MPAKKEENKPEEKKVVEEKKPEEKKPADEVKPAATEEKKPVANDK